MWLFWHITCLVALIGSALALEHGLFLPFCRGGIYLQLDYTISTLSLLAYIQTAWLFLILYTLHLGISILLHQLQHWNDKLLFESWGLQSILIGGKPGPKSGWYWRRLSPPFWWRLILLCATLVASTRGEGCGRPMASAEVPIPQWASDFIRSGTKQHGTRPGFSLEPLSWAPTDNYVKKRSMKRAHARACRDGISWCKGRAYTPADFPEFLQRQAISSGSSPALQPSGRKDLNIYNQRQCSKRRIQILSWNVGGLSQARLDEVRTWALEQQIGVVTLLETRWPWVSEWEDSRFLYIHSGVPGDRSCGILIMIAKWLCPSSGLRWSESIPGRLLHVQLRLRPRPLDFVACYQYCFNSKSNRLADRRRWWDQFSSMVGDLPTRHVLAIAGDFNCSLPAARSHVGHSEFQWGAGASVGTTHSDSDVFLNLIRTLNLNILNSWNPKLGPTYIKDQVGSRIDYCLVRNHKADGVARDVKYLWHPPFVVATRDHCQLLFQITRYWIPAPLSSHVTGCTMQQRALGRTAYLEDSALWQSYVQTSHDHLTHMVPQLDPHDDELFLALNQTLLADFQATFPKQHTPNSAVWQDSHPWIKTKWTHRSLQHTLIERMQAGQLQIKTMFQFWHHVTRFKVLTKSHRRHAQMVRKHHFQDIIHLAQKAADRHNSFQLFHLINSFAPKSPKRRMQLRTVHGTLATAVEEHSILCKFVQDVWHGDPLLDAHPHVIPGTPFTEFDVQKALESIPLTKAVAPGFAPGVLWRSHAQSLAPWLYGILQCWWFSPKPFIPSTWRHALALLAPQTGETPHQSCCPTPHRSSGSCRQSYDRYDKPNWATRLFGFHDLLAFIGIFASSIYPGFPTKSCSTLPCCQTHGN